MEMELRLVALEEGEILANLLEKYQYEFSQYDFRKVNRLGLYGYHYLDSYWNAGNRWPYFIFADGHLAGFVLVRALAEDELADFQIAEFFVMYPYRREHLGKRAFFQVLALHKGRWQLKRHPKNFSAAHFWDSAVNEFTGGSYQFVEADSQSQYDDGSYAEVLLFQS